MNTLSSLFGTSVKVAVLLFLSLVVYNGFVAGPELNRPLADDPDWYAELNSSSEVRHRAALDELLQRGPAAVLILQDMAESNNQDVRRVAFQALAELYRIADNDLADAIDDCLFELRHSDNRDIGAAAQNAIYDSDEERCVNLSARFRNLGATVRELSQSRWGARGIEPPIDLGVRNTPLLVEFGPDWHGSDDDLLQLTRLPRLQALYFGASAQVSAEFRGQLHELMPGVRIISTGSPCLGFTGQDTILGFRISTVEPDSPADVAGMRPGDVLVAVNANRIEDSGDVLAALSSGASGDMLSLEIHRHGERELLKPILGRYARSPDRGVHCACFDDADFGEL